MSTERPPVRPFVHLHVHTHYSLLDGATRVPDLVKIAGENNMPAVAITDHGVMYGAVELYNAAKYANIKPIIGADISVIDGDITDRSTRQPMHQLVLLCKNETGYKNLVKIISRAHLEGFYYKPRVNWDIIKRYSEGLIALSGDLTGPVARPILRGHPEEARDRAKFLKDVFGEDFYLEIVDHGKEPEYRFSVEAARIGKELGIELVATNDSHFSRPGDETMHSILLCMQQGKTLAEGNSRELYGPNYYIKNGDEMAQLFQHLDIEVRERALDNTLAIADKIDFKMRQGESILPDFPVPEGVSLEEALHRQVEKDALERFGEITPEIRERLDFELGIINQMGFPAYFLIVADFIRFGRENDIPVGPGRGSAAGSLVAFTLGITDINPIEHNLLFERFLNPERVSMPDVDIDFCIEGRERVIQYVREKYGADKVCQIITFGTLAARAALKAVARVMDIPYAESDKLAKMIPFGPGIKLKDALEEGMELKKLYDSDENVKQLVDLALSIEGTACNVGMHAAGVVISKDPLDSIVPVQYTKDGQDSGQIVSQFSMGDVEKIGLLKMDFLGLRNLTIIDNTIKLVQETHDGKFVDMRNLPLDDPGVYEMLTAGETDGVFQLESGGMRALVKDLKPSVFEDIGALVALYRPGPLNSGMVKQFVDRKHGRAQVEYKHPALEPILKDTYGTIVYQEQIMQIAQSLAGYSLGQADLLRRAMGKKKAEIMEKEREGFLAGCEKNDVDLKMANELFDTMSEFAAYCFNRSHSAAYALVAYQTAYLKVHYPVEYLSALLSSVMGDLEKVQFYILAARKMGLKILPPDINKSGINFTPDGEDSIRFGLASLKGVGVGVVESIIAARTEKPFTSVEDFCERVDPKVMNRKTLESLINAGAFSNLGVSRKQLATNVDTLTGFAAKCQERRITGQVNLFAALAVGGGDGGSGGGGGFGGLILTGSPEEYTDEEIQHLEKELLGFYVSSHPLDRLTESLPMMTTHTMIELKELADGTDVMIGGLISSLQKKITKTNRPIWIGKLEDFSGETEFVMFSDAIEKIQALHAENPEGRELVADGGKVIINGRLQFRGDDSQTHSVVVNEVRPVQDVQLMNLFFQQSPRWEELMTIAQILAKNRGYNPVILNFKDGTRIKTGAKFWVNGNRDSVKDMLETHFGQILKVS